MRTCCGIGPYFVVFNYYWNSSLSFALFFLRQLGAVVDKGAWRVRSTLEGLLIWTC